MMKCEFPNCNSSEGKDYYRKKETGPWACEPIFLCHIHSEGHEPIGEQKTVITSEGTLQQFKDLTNNGKKKNI